MLQLQPQLRRVDDYLKTVSAEQDRWSAYVRAKNIMARLVGFNADKPVLDQLAGNEAYEVGIAHITDVLEI